MKFRISLTLALAFTCAGSLLAADKDAKTAAPMAGAPIMVKPAGNGQADTNAPKSLQNAAMNEEFMKMVMEASSKIDAAKKAISDRQAKLYETSPAIVKIQKKMIEMQREINALVESDPEYAELKIKRDILSTIMPDMPKSAFPMSMPNGMSPRPMGPGQSAPMMGPGRPAPMMGPMAAPSK